MIVNLILFHKTLQECKISNEAEFLQPSCIYSENNKIRKFDIENERSV